MKKLFCFLALLTLSVFAKQLELNYNGYLMGYYNADTKSYENGSEKLMHEMGTLFVNVEGDSSSTVLDMKVFNRTYSLKIVDFKESVNEDKDSVVIFKGEDENKQHYTLVVGPEYINFLKEYNWKLCFKVPLSINQDAGEKQGKKSKGNVSTGSGFAINNHTLVTNNHVIEGKKIVVVSKTPDVKKSFMDADVVYTDPDLDLAILHTDSNLTACALDKKVYDIGEDVFVYGYPQIRKQGHSLKLTKGVISSKRGFKDDVKTYQIDAAVQHGNSGGPLVRKGKVIGVVSAMLKNSQNVNYAIKSNFLAAVLDVLEIKASGKADPKNCTYVVIGSKK